MASLTLIIHICCLIEIFYLFVLWCYWLFSKTFQSFIMEIEFVACENQVTWQSGLFVNTFTLHITVYVP